MVHRSRLQEDIEHHTQLLAQGIRKYEAALPNLYRSLLSQAKDMEERKYDLDEGHYAAYQMYAISAGDAMFQLHRTAEYASKGYLTTEKKLRKAQRYAATAYVLVRNMKLCIFEERRLQEATAFADE